MASPTDIAVHLANMDIVRQAVLYLILIGAFYGVILAMKALSRVQVPSGYDDVENLTEYTSYRLDQTVTLTGWKPGDAICWRLGADAENAVNFGWVAALPGDRVQIREGRLEVNGQRHTRGDEIRLPDCGPVYVPDRHLFVISDRHQRDSIAVGPLPASALRGRLGSLP